MNAPASGWFFNRLAELRRILLRQGERRRARSELREMGDRELLDIAVGRGEIPYLLAQMRRVPAVQRSHARAAFPNS